MHIDSKTLFLWGEINRYLGTLNDDFDAMV